MIIVNLDALKKDKAEDVFTTRVLYDKTCDTYGKRSYVSLRERKSSNHRADAFHEK